MTSKLRTLIVDDAAVYRAVLRRILSGLEGVEIVGEAADGRAALALAAMQKPDVILLDIEMPVLDGLETLDVLKRAGSEAAVLIVSSRVDAARTLKALSLGALEIVLKPEAGTEPEKSLRSSLERCFKIIHARREMARAPVVPRSRPEPVKPLAYGVGALERLVVLGISTGGPKALSELVPALGPELGCGILVVQHMPAGFTTSLAESLARRSGLEVVEARDGDAVGRRVLVAPGGRHMELALSGSGVPTLRLGDGPMVNGCRPSVDQLFESVARSYSGAVLAIVMTGMGVDGCAGVRALKRRGGYCIAQSAETCVVYGMPRAVAEAGLADEVLSIEGITRRIREFALPTLVGATWSR